MARIHARTKGKSGSSKPATADLSFVTMKKAEIEKKVVELAKQDINSSLIGLMLRDTYGVPSVKLTTGKSVSDILKENKIAPAVPEDLNNLVVKAIKLKKHISNNTRDIHNKRGLILIESKIRRLSKYYKNKNRLPRNWSYK